MLTPNLFNIIVEPVAAENEPVIPNEPVICAEPVNGKAEAAKVSGNVEPSPLLNVIVAPVAEAVTKALGVLEALKANEAVTAFCACDDDIAKLELTAVVANEADVALAAKLALSAFTTLLAVILNVEPSPLVNVVVALLIDAVVTNEPVSIGVTFKANDAVTAFCACEALNAYEALVAVLALVANDELIAVVAKDAVVAKLELTACEAEVANDELVAVEAKLALVALVANEELIDALTLFITLVNVVPSPLVNVIVSLLLDAVRTLFNANDAVEANDELVVVFDVEANDAEIAFCAKDALVANDAEIAVVAVSALPVKLPTKVVAFILVAANVFVKGT
jgi:hypothetical protein